MLTTEGRHKLQGIAEADSICMDAHKLLPLHNSPLSLLVVRDASALYRLNSCENYDTKYLDDFFFTKSSSTHEGLINWADLTPEQTRDPRGLRLWFLLQLHGIETFENILTKNLKLLQLLEEGLRKELKEEGIQFLAPLGLGVLVFRLTPPSLFTKKEKEKAEKEKSLLFNQYNRDLLKVIVQRNTVFLGQTTLKGHFGIRIGMFHYARDESAIVFLISEIKQSAKILSHSAKL